MGPWILIGGMVLVVIYLASKTDAANNTTTPGATLPANETIPIAGAAPISPATAMGSPTSSQIFQRQRLSGIPLVTTQLRSPPVPKPIPKLAPVTGPNPVSDASIKQLTTAVQPPIVRQVLPPRSPNPNMPLLNGNSGSKF